MENARSLTGTLYALYRNDPGSIAWAFRVDDVRGSTALHILADGDRLTIFGTGDDIVWRGIIDLDTQTGSVPRSTHPGTTYQLTRGNWALGFQRGLTMDDWSDFFFRRLRAQLTPGHKAR